MHWFDSVSMVLLVVAVAVFGAAVNLLWGFVRSSGRDPLTPYAPDERSARARRWAWLSMSGDRSPRTPHWTGTPSRPFRTRLSLPLTPLS